VLKWPSNPPRYYAILQAGAYEYPEAVVLNYLPVANVAIACGVSDEIKYNIEQLYAFTDVNFTAEQALSWYIKYFV
jgi:hypothetical protein